jgi:hypothetical protein
MAFINFPTSPSLNDEYTFEGRTWLWNGSGWEIKSFVAEPGATGATGPTGATGAVGATGATGATPAVGGSDTQVLFNDGGAIGGDAGLIYDKTTDALTVTGSTTSASFVPTSATVPTNGLYLPAANTVGVATNGAVRIRIRSDGNIGIGATGTTNVTIDNRKPLTGGTDAYAYAAIVSIQSDVTNNAYIYRSQLTTPAASFTLANAYHFHTVQATLGAGSAITNQFGYWAGNMTGATNNYGFYGNVPSDTGRWNFYAAGTAPNYFAGDVRSNTTVTCRSAPTNSNTTATATAASLLDGIRTGTPTADIDLQLPTGTNMDAAFQDLQTNQSFEWSVINLATAASGFDITVTANTDHTVVGQMVVTGETSGRFLTRKTAANTFVTYRIA